MAVYELSDDKMQIKIKGQVYEMSEPTIDQTKAVQKRFEDCNVAEGQDPIDIYVDFVVELGLPQEIAKGLSVRKLTDLYSYAVGLKKN